jgi:hypothetical protein
MAEPLQDLIKIKNQEEYIRYGFTSINVNGQERLQCVICCEVLEKESFEVN